MSDQFDVLTSFKIAATKQIQRLTKRVEEISILCDRSTKSLDVFEDYCYQYNVKIVRLPVVAENETSEQTTQICQKIFSALGVEDVTANLMVLISLIWFLLEQLQQTECCDM